MPRVAARPMVACLSNATRSAWGDGSGASLTRDSISPRPAVIARIVCSVIGMSSSGLKASSTRQRPPRNASMPCSGEG